MGPDVDDLVVALGLGDQRVLGLLLDLLDLAAGLDDGFFLERRDVHVRDRDGQAGGGGVVEADALEVVQEQHRAVLPQRLVAALDQLGELLLALRGVEVAQLRRDDLVEEHASDRGPVLPLVGVHGLGLLALAFDLVELLGDAAHLDAGVQVDLAGSGGR